MIVDRPKPNHLRRYAVAICTAILLAAAYDSFSQSTGGGGGGGGGTPGGSTTQIQYNNGGAFGGLANFTTDSSAHLTLASPGAASTAAMLLNGTVFTGGSATTTFPLFYINQGSTAVTTFSTNGTEIGVNAPSGFTGLLMDMYVNGGSSLFNVNASGNGGVAGSWFVGTSANIQTNMTFAGSTGNANIINGGTGHILFNSVNATVSGTGLGTSPSITGNGSGAMDITVGTSPSAATFTITFGVSATNGYICTGSDITTNSTTVFVLKQTGAQAVNTCVMGIFSDVAALAAPAAADHLRVMAIAY